nr:hypothetical protein [Tanacetum cinerariifolium]
GRARHGGGQHSLNLLGNDLFGNLAAVGHRVELGDGRAGADAHAAIGHNAHAVGAGRVKVQPVLVAAASALAANAFATIAAPQAQG